MRADLATRIDLADAIGSLRSEMRWMFSFQIALIVAIAARLLASFELVCETAGFEVDDPARCRLQNIVTPTQSDGNYHGAPARICPKSSTMPWI